MGNGGLQSQASFSRENCSRCRFRDLLACRLQRRKYNSARLKTKCLLSVIAILAGNAIQTEADEASPTRQAFA